MMSEELAKSIVQAASIMEQKPKRTQIALLYLKNGEYYFCKDLLVGADVQFEDAYNHALAVGYIPVEDDHPA